MKFNPEKTKKIVKNLTVFAVFFLSLSAIFFAPKTFSSAPTKDCNDSSIGTPLAGNNCLYTINNNLLPLCSDVPSKSWTIVPADSILSGTTANHRVNCADLIDLPLCSQVSDTSTAYPLKNCVNECSTISNPDETHDPAYVRGSDYAVHNRDCIRFCDAVESGMNANAGTNCVSRACHQVAYVGTPTSGNVVPDPPSNCNLLSCNLLVPDELNESKFGDSNTSAYKYCDNQLKCLEFTQAQLPYVEVGSTCKIHDCRVSCVDNATDDVAKILAKSSGYISDYQRLINAGYVVGSASEPLCTQIMCKPIVQIPYRCDPQAQVDPAPSTPNASCDTTGAGHTCSNGYCYKTVDCNLDANANSLDCITGGTDSETVGTTDDSNINSWFYRPKPVDTALNSNGTLKEFNYDTSFDPDNVGYTINQMHDLYGWGSESFFQIPFGTLGTLTVNMGYMHSSVFGDGARSPRMADGTSAGNVAELGNRGVGFGYLCNMHANIYNMPRSDTAYHRGYVQTVFTDTDATHTLSVCLRFTNTLAFDHSCGQRECALSCVFEKPDDDIDGCTQLCGYDICRTLTLKDSDPFQCVMSEDISKDGDGSMTGSGSTSRDCMMTVDGYIRLRAVKYGDYICTFLDAKGTTAYDAIYYDGSEQLADGTCISGSKETGSTTCSGGYNTNKNAGDGDRWRTVMRIPYIQSTVAGTEPQGYLDKSGRLFPAQECIKVYHRITVPPLYNLANISNSSKLFIPPLYILNSMTKRDSNALSSIPTGQDLGDTDFHYPEITVSFGTTTQRLSLDFGKTGYESGDDIDARSTATMTTSIGDDSSATYEVEVYIRKEYDETANRPSLCLYQKVQDAGGTYLDPQRIGCVFRNYPDINNSDTKSVFPSVDFRKVVVAADSTNTYLSSKIAIQYLSSSTNNATCSTAGTSCSTTLSLSNLTPGSETCDSTVENHKICVQRDECSKLNIECIQNEINAHAAEIANQPTDSFEIIRNQCNTITLPYCNAKFGITASTAASIINPNPSNAPADANAYGWFNELCISSGFSTQLKRVVAYKTTSGVMGKCLIDNTKKTAGADCSAGGKSPNCPCVVYDGVSTLASNLVDRDQTYHEAGLCIDMPLPQLCAAINHNPSPNSNVSDLDYITSSLGYSTFGSTLAQSSQVVNISHKIRTYGLGDSTTPGTVSNTFNISNIPTAGHGEFPQSIFGFNDVQGTCTGFWKQATNSSGNSVPPTMSCLNSGGAAVWGTVTNACVRYSCPAISTAGMDVNGNYQGGYGLLESGENKGLSNGFANWPETQSSDIPTNATATSCIVGFKTSGAVTQKPSTETVDYAALYQHITGYSVVTLPTRQCDQLGNWQTTSSSCERISCASVNLDDDGYIDDDHDGITIENASGNIDWTLWTNSGGATFPKVNAARSTNLTDPSSVAKAAATSTGTCNNALGFFQMIGAPTPTRVCDYLGNWGPVQNPCVTRCEAITDADIASTTSNGYAYWYQAINVPLGSQLASTTNGCPSGPQFTDNGSCQTNGFKGCVSGYVASPYSSLKQQDGTHYTLANCGTGIGTCADGTIPQDITKDTRAAGNPERVCKSVITAAGQTNVWTSTSSSCVNSCPGADIDPRYNVGKTQHPTSIYASGQVNGVVTISWTTTPFGSWAYVNSPNDINSQNASQYFYGRTNGYYSLARYCNPTTHQWEAPIPACVNNGADVKIGTSDGASSSAGASYGSSAVRIAVAGSSITSGTTDPSLSTLSGACTSGYYSNSSGSTTAPAITCSYKDSNNRIDETYFDTAGSALCSPMCSSSQNTTYGSGSIDNLSNTRYYNAGSQLTLSCLSSDYGSAIITGSSISASSAFASCNSSYNTDRSSSAPYITCNTNANGSATWSSVYNDCSACRSCNSSSSIYVPYFHSDNSGWEYTASCKIDYGDGNDCYAFNGSGCSSADGYSHHDYSISTSLDHQSLLYLCQYQTHGGDSSASFGVKCVDGTLNVKVYCDSSNDYGNNNSWKTSTTSNVCNSNVGF